MKTLQNSLAKETIRPLFKEVRLGIEKESQRVTLDGQLATTDHPRILGNRSFHPTIQTDFSETQVEIITPVTNSPKEVLEYLGAIHEVVLRSMNEDEMLWPLSMPPVLPEKDENIMIAKLERFEDVLYRRYLARSYGKRKQMVSGIHYNFEFSKELMYKLFLDQKEYEDFQTFETNVYMKVSRNYLRYRWLITYLFGASPVSEEGYFTGCDANVPNEPVRSIRNSHFGYTNHDDVFVSYKTIEDYVSDIHRLVDHGFLSEEKEFYAAVRLRGANSVAEMQKKGVHYIEIRNIDNDPFAPYGLKEETIRFLQLFLMYMLWLDNESCDEDELLRKGDSVNNQVALEHPLEKTALYEEGMEILKGMKEMIQATTLREQDEQLLEKAQECFDFPEKTLAGQMLTLQNQGISNAQLGVQQGRAARDHAMEKPYQLEGFRDMELSTQLFMFDAIQRGLEVEVLDRHDQFLRLKHHDHEEFVKNGNMTSLDNYVVPLIMENKTVTKKLLARKWFRVPEGKEFATIEEALDGYAYFKGQGIVIKPKSTNYGLGISIFKEGASREDYEEGIRIAFAEDTEVLVEEYMAGTEYRFFVIEGEVKAILLRVPANVTGDGTQTIQALVDKKNQDPLRGTNHRAPLELIETGDLEKLMLKEQGYQLSDVLEKDKTVYLRENSNISTGGDSVDVTDDFSEDYKNIAIEAVKTLGAKISGIDLIIPDKDKTPEPGGKDYGIIEANFNPAMHMHTYPYAGKGRRLTNDVLNCLYPELKQVTDE